MNHLEKSILALGNKVGEELNIIVPLVKVVTAKKLIVQIFLENKDLTPVTLVQCSVFSRQLSVLLDVEDFVPENRYTLEVSSLGINRPLLQFEDYERFLNHDVKILTKINIEGAKSFTGKLIAVTSNNITIKLHDKHNEIEEIIIDFNNIYKAKLDLVKNFAAKGRKNGK